ncbi:HIT domain-containing protein [Spirillospora sp. NPDC052269]
MTSEKHPMDHAAYEAAALNGPCFICALLADDPAYTHEIVHEDDETIAFLDRWPTVPAKVLVAPKPHIEHVVRDLDEAAYTRLMLTVRRVALAVESVVRPERTYLLSLGSQQGNAHLHWHIAGLPRNVPYREQQFHALMSENGVLRPSPAESGALATRLREALSR